MNVKVQLNNLRTAPRKVRLIADLIRNKSAGDARSLLEFAVKKPAGPVLKLLNSAVSSALHDFKLQESDLYVSKITVDEGQKLKRWHPMSRGRAYPIMKRTSHITLVLSDGKKDKEEKKASKITRVMEDAKSVKTKSEKQKIKSYSINRKTKK